MNAPVDFINLLVRPPGDLFYYLAVFGLSQVALFMALGQRMRRKRERPPQRYTTAAVGAVIVWALLMLGAMVALLANQSANVILPPTERLAHVVTTLLMGWAFLTADSARWDRLSRWLLPALLSLVIIGFMFTALDWVGAAANQSFATSSYGVAWAFIPAVFALLGVLVTLAYFREVVDAPLKALFFVLILIGYGGALLQFWQGTLEGDYAGLPRLTFLTALLIVPVAIYRMIIASLDSPILPQAAPVSVGANSTTMAAPDVVRGAGGERESALMMKALGLMLEQATPDSIPDRIVQAVLQTVKADVGALLVVQDANYADVTHGFDRTFDRPLAGISLNLADQPTLVNAIERRLQRPLYPDRNPEELRDLYTRLDIEAIGPTYFQPLVHERELLAILLVGLPYAGRELAEAEQELLKGIGIISANLLALSNAARDARLEAESRVIQAMIRGVSPDAIDDDSFIAIWQELQGELETARDQIQQLSRQVTELKLALDDERSRVAQTLSDTAEGQSISQRIILLNEEHQRLLEERERLAARLREAETTLASLTTDDSGAIVKSMVDILRREKEDLLAERDRLQAQLLTMRERGELAEPDAIQDLLARMAEEKTRTEVERDRLSAMLQDIETQLSALGVPDGAAGLTALITQLYEQRAALQSRNEALRRERDALLSGRSDASLIGAAASDRQIEALQHDLARLAADREAATKQRDRLRAERDELLARLESMREQYTRLLAEATAFEQELTEAHEEQRLLRAQIQQLVDERSRLMRERDRLIAEYSAIGSEREQLLARIEGDRDRLQQLGEDGVGALTAMIDELSAQRGALERELVETRNQLAAVEEHLEVMRIRAANVQPQVVYRPDNPEVMLGMVQELRTPMTSIMGYVDLILNESAGILGEMQRKFMQRVAANIHRLEAMLDDLIQLALLDAGRYKLNPEQVDVVELIEDAITRASNQLREKDLTVHLHLDDEAPLILADRGAIDQIIGQLLTNAYLVSPAGSELYISARAEMLSRAGAEPVPCLKLSVGDRGGGIGPEDQPHVFARKYKAENPLIQGLGDTGVGLAIAKALVEAHDGEIWLETETGVGTIFHVALPVQLTPEVEH
ncbi:MAG: ATP-binding protein [Aggregatilineales bacterium]